MLSGFAGVFLHDWKLLFSDRVNILGSITPSIIYVLLFSTSLSRLVNTIPYHDVSVPYTSFALSGVVFTVAISCATQLANGMFSEKSSGMGLEIWSLPVSALGYFVGKLTCAALYLLLQVVPMLALAAWVLNVHSPAAVWLLYLVSVLLSALTLSAALCVIALLMTNMRRFLILLNIAQPVLIFTAPIFYNYSDIPTYLRWISAANPMTYGIELGRGFLLLGQVSWQPLAVTCGLLVTTVALCSCLLRKMRASL